MTDAVQRPIRVVVADDSAVMRNAVAGVLRADPAFNVVAVVKNGREAVTALLGVEIDVAVMDVEMPELDGLGALRELRAAHCRTKVVMFSTTTQRGSRAAVEALTSGAVDCVAKPTGVGNLAASIDRIRVELVPRLKAIGVRPGGHRVAPPASAGAEYHRHPHLIAIGASTGGPDALCALLTALPRGFDIPIAVVQHIPATFARALTERLTQVARRTVQEVTAEVPLRRGAIMMATGDAHLVVTAAPDGSLRARPTHSPPVNNVRPSVDVLLTNLPPTLMPATVVVILTGMGRDGADGAQVVARNGGHVMVQDEASSVVWGMPGAVVKAGVAHVVAPIPHLARALGEIQRTRTIPIPVMRGVP
jgi:two-component system chemotaxis response regulator CheB